MQPPRRLSATCQSPFSRNSDVRRSPSSSCSTQARENPDVPQASYGARDDATGEHRCRWSDRMGAFASRVVGSGARYLPKKRVTILSCRWCDARRIFSRPDAKSAAPCVPPAPRWSSDRRLVTDVGTFRSPTVSTPSQPGNLGAPATRFSTSGPRTILKALAQR